MLGSEREKYGGWLLNGYRGLRSQLGIEKRYIELCREERNLAAVLYHLLQDEERLLAFLRLAGVRDPDVAEAEVYFEYACLRDLWAEASQSPDAHLDSRNTRLRDAVVAMLQVAIQAVPSLSGKTGPEWASSGLPDLPPLAGGSSPCEAFNRYFIGESRPVSGHAIQMPARWDQAQFDRWAAHGGPGFAGAVCLLKWAFNAKPDLVIDLGNGGIVCVEAKLGSGIGAYQARGSMGVFRVDQLALQEFIVRDLLDHPGSCARFITVSERVPSPRPGWTPLSWRNVLAALSPESPDARRHSRTVRAFCGRWSSGAHE